MKLTVPSDFNRSGEEVEEKKKEERERDEKKERHGRRRRRGREIGTKRRKRSILKLPPRFLHRLKAFRVAECVCALLQVLLFISGARLPIPNVPSH